MTHDRGDQSNSTTRLSAGTWMLPAWLAVTVVWWLLALAPVQNPPGWLSVARSVCFGTADSGLPDTYGWVVLIVGPGSLLVAILGAWGGAVWRDTQRLLQSGAGKAVIATMFAVVLATAWAVGGQIRKGLAIANTDFGPKAQGELPEDYPVMSKPVPEFELVQQSGETFTQADFKNTTTLLTFAFGHCETICPLVVRTAVKATAQVEGAAPQVVVVTLDPWRDTPNRLMHMVHHWEMPDSGYVLSGEVAAVQSVLDELNVPRERDEETGEVSHPPLVYVVNADGDIAYAFNNPSAQWLAQAVQRAR